MSKITITYEIDDGYVGGSAPHHVTVDTSDFEYMELPEIEEQIHIIVQEDFVMNISPYTTPPISTLAVKIKAMVEAERETE